MGDTVLQLFSFLTTKNRAEAIYPPPFFSDGKVKPLVVETLAGVQVLKPLL